MTTPLLADCSGLWRRSLLINADGSHDAGGDVRWLQGITAYVDSRGFAGRLQQSGNVFEWHRDIDLEPPGEFPDVGTVHWDGDTLVETGIHRVYAEHWVRDAGPAGPGGAVYLHGSDGEDGLLLRVGDQFGWAGAGTVVIGGVDGPQWDALAIELSDDSIQAHGRRWSITASEGELDP